MLGSLCQKGKLSFYDSKEYIIMFTAEKVSVFLRVFPSFYLAVGVAFAERNHKQTLINNMLTSFKLEQTVEIDRFLFF